LAIGGHASSKGGGRDQNVTPKWNWYARGVTKCVPVNVDRKLVKRLFVRQIDDAETDADLRLVAMEQVVDAEPEIDQMPRCNPRRIVDIVLRALWGYDQTLRSSIGRGAARQRCVECRDGAAAE
jgi:hypothetical protein